MEGGAFVQDLGIALGVAAITGAIAHRFKQPAIVGYLAAGLVIGPYVPIPLLADPERIRELAEFGVVLVMFVVGLDFRVSRLLELLPRAGLTATFQVGTVAFLGSLLAAATGFAPMEQVFLGAALAISSTMVVSAVYQDREIDRQVRELVLGVLVVQDVIAIVLIAVLAALVTGSGLSAGALGGLMVQLVLALMAMAFAGMLVVPRLVGAVLRMNSPEATVVVAGGVAFGFAALAMRFGYSPALGAFLGGVLVAEAGAAHHLERKVRPLRDAFAAVFFVSVGMGVDPRLAIGELPTVIAATALVVLGQLASVTVGGVLSGNGVRTSMTAGFALGQVGEFGFLIAGLAVAAGAGPRVSAVVVGVALATVLTTPFFVDRSDKLVAAFEARLSPGALRLLELYQTWFVAFREGPARSPLLRALGVWTLDGLGLVLLAAAYRSWSGLAVTYLREAGVVDPWGRTVVIVASLLLAVPLLLGAARTAWSVSALAASRAGARAADGPPAASHRLVQAMVRLLVLLGTGVPMAAITRPFLGVVPSLMLALLLLVAAWWVWRRLGEVDEELRSGGEDIVRWLRADARGPTPVSVPRIEGLRTVTLSAGSPAIGATLRDLDLRARTGASVVLLMRHHDRVVAPPPDEILRLDDVLGLVGEERALAVALAELGPPAGAIRRREHVPG